MSNRRWIKLKRKGYKALAVYYPKPARRKTLGAYIRHTMKQYIVYINPNNSSDMLVHINGELDYCNTI